MAMVSIGTRWAAGEQPPGNREEASREAHAAFWGLTAPMAVTGIGLAAFVSRIVVLGAARRRHDQLPAVIAYAWAMACAWLLSFKLLEVEWFH